MVWNTKVRGCACGSCQPNCFLLGRSTAGILFIGFHCMTAKPTRAYEYRHVVGFEETNLVGNVYYANHIRWQGRCREMFLRDHAPEVSEEMARGLCLITTRCSCEYLAEVNAFDEVVIRMRLADLAQNRITMFFEYLRSAGGNGEEIVARGEQQIVCMQRSEGRLEPAPIPRSLVDALKSYS